jgi:hypothetical protein
MCFYAFLFLAKNGKNDIMESYRRARSQSLWRGRSNKIVKLFTHLKLTKKI